MPTLSLALGDASNAWGSSHGQLQDGGLVFAATRRTTGWIVGTKASGQMSPMVWGTKQANATFTGTAVPAASPTTNNCLRSINSYRGTFAAAAWTFSFSLRSNTSAYTGRVRFRFRVFRSTNQDGSSVTELTSSTIVGNATTANLATGSSQTVTASWTPGGTITLTDEYLFVEVGLEVTSAGGGSTQDALLVTDTSNSVITTSTFTADATTAFVKGFSSSFAAAPNGKDYIFGSIRNIADEPTLRVFQKDLAGASDLFAVFWAGDVSSASRWYLAASADGGLTWTNYAASNGEPSQDTNFNNYGLSMVQSSDGKVHFLSWNGNDANLWYNRVALTRDGSGHISGWSWEAERVASVTPVLAGSELRVHLEKCEDANGVKRLLVVFMDNPHLQGTGGVYMRVCAAVTTPGVGQTPTAATSWCKLTNSSSTNAFDVLGAWSTNASTDANAFVNFTGIGTTVPTDNHNHVHSEGVLSNRDVHIFHGGWAYQDQTPTVPSSVRRWRLTNASGSNWTNDGAVNGATMLTDDGSHRPLLTGSACVTSTAVYVPLMTSAGKVQIDKIDTSGTRTQDVFSGLDPTSASAGYYVALSVAVDDGQAWAIYMKGITTPDYFRSAHHNGTSWHVRYDDTLERWAANPAANYGTGNQNVEWVPIYQGRDVTNGVIAGSFPNAQYIAGGGTHTNSVMTFLNPGGLAASLVGSVSGSATSTGALTSGISLAATLSGATTVAGALTSAIRLAASASGAATVAGALSTAIPLAATVAGSATASASLTVANAVAGDAAGSAAVSGALTTVIPLTVAASGSATAAGALTTQIPLSAATAGASVLSAALSTAIPLAGQVSGAPSISGDLAVSAAFTGDIAGTSSASATLSTSVQLAAALTGTSSASGTISAGVSLAGNISGAPTVTAELATGIRLAGAPAGAASASGALDTAVRLRADVVAQGVVSSALSASIRLLADAAAGAEVRGDLTASIRLAVAVAVGTELSGALSSTGTALDGDVSAGAVLVGALGTSIPLAASFSASSSASGVLGTGIPLAGDAAGASAAGAALSSVVILVVNARGSASLFGDLETAIRLSVSVSGTAALTAFFGPRHRPTPPTSEPSVVPGRSAGLLVVGGRTGTLGRT